MIKPDTDATYEIALSMVRRMTPDIVRILPEKGISPVDFFEMDTPALSHALGLRKGASFEKMDRDEALFAARREIELMDKHNIRGYFLLDPDYPSRLFQIPDPPLYLYQIGDADLDCEHMMSLVGTRKPTQYGMDFCRRLVEDLSAYFPDLTVVSGLAYGIDAAAHNAALSSSATTVAVVAHGLDMIYPAQHRDLARMILRQGGSIITEYPFGEKPFRQRFLERNRIVAGLSDVTVVAESSIKGGAMSTANTAFSYSRDVMALPGRTTDQLSEGCNMLIRKEKAHLLTCAADLIETTGWRPLGIEIEPRQRNLFPELEGDAKTIYELLRFCREPMQIDSIHSRTLIPLPRLTATLADMEFDGIVIRHAGNRYSVA